MKNILIIEDDPDIGNLIRKSLTSSHYLTTVRESGEDGLKTYQESKPDLIILDLSLPGIDGMEVCKSIRKTDDITPIFILSARNEEIDRIMGLELGADDYITKPFSIRELKARIDAFFRRWDRKDAVVEHGETVTSGNLTIDSSRRKVMIGKEPINISRKEFDILILLAKSPGKVFSREMILESIWGTEWEGYERMIDSHVKRIRSKLDQSGSNKQEWIETIWGVGYRFTDSFEEN